MDLPSVESGDSLPLVGPQPHSVAALKTPVAFCPSIRNMEPAWEKVNGRNFALVEYRDKKGELRPCYRLSKTECLYIATKFNDEARAKLVIRWEQLEMEDVRGKK